MLTFKDDDFRHQIEEETGVRPEWAAEAFEELDQDVRQNIARIKASLFMPHKDSVRGFIYDVTNGHLREVTPYPAQRRADDHEPAAPRRG
jgi:carbonic anhydrase